MTRAAMIPKRPRDYWYRRAGQARTLEAAVRGALKLGGYGNRADEILHYIGSTEWGEELYDSQKAQR